MSDRKAQNKYIPPDFDPVKHKSVNGYRNSHHLRQRANKLSEGILVIRFEMPYDSWCLHCDTHIGQGVRFNAQKKIVGKYLTTSIYEFSMKCHECGGELIMRTDPKNAEYECGDGLRKKISTYTADNGSGHLELQSDVDKEKMYNDAFYRLEHAKRDKEKLISASERIEQLQQLNDRQWKDPFEHSQHMRKIFRNDKKSIKEQAAKDAIFSKRKNLTIPLLPETNNDKLVSAEQKYFLSDVALNNHLKRKAELDAFILKPTFDKNSDIKKLTQMELKRRKLMDSLSATYSDIVVIKKERKHEKESPASSMSLVAGYSSDDES